MKPVVVGFSGRKQSGKDTCADHLVRRYGFKKVSFAGKLKKLCAMLFDLDLGLLDGTDDQKNSLTHLRWSDWELTVEDPHHPEYLTHREVLQVVGTQVFRSKYQNIWVHTLFSGLEDGCQYVIPDARFDNEADAITESGGFVIKVERAEAESVVDHHESERGLSQGKYHHVLRNETTLEDLFRTLDEVMRSEGIHPTSPSPSTQEGSPVMELKVPEPLSRAAKYYYDVTQGNPLVLQDLVFQVCSMGVQTQLRDCLEVAKFLGEVPDNGAYFNKHTLIFINSSDASDDGILLDRGALEKTPVDDTAIVAGVSDSFSECFVYGVLTRESLEELLLFSPGEREVRVPFKSLHPLRYLVEDGKR